MFNHFLVVNSANVPDFRVFKHKGFILLDHGSKTFENQQQLLHIQLGNTYFSAWIISCRVYRLLTFTREQE